MENYKTFYTELRRIVHDFVIWRKQYGVRQKAGGLKNFQEVAF